MTCLCFHIIDLRNSELLGVALDCSKLFMALAAVECWKFMETDGNWRNQTCTLYDASKKIWFIFSQFVTFFLFVQKIEAIFLSKCHGDLALHHHSIYCIKGTSSDGPHDTGQPLDVEVIRVICRDWVGGLVKSTKTNQRKQLKKWNSKEKTTQK